jgi:hypothetical protein
MPSSPASEYECALSGKAAADTDLVPDDKNDESDLGEMPVGWIRVTVQRRGVNPAWLEIQKRKARQLAGMQAQIPDLADAERAEAVEDTRMAVEAAFFAIEQGTPKYVTVEDVAYVSNPDANKQIVAEWKKIADALSLDVSGG